MKKIINLNNVDRKILLLIFLFNFTISYSQVGINTENVKGIFHIDGQSDNSKSGIISPAALKNDVIVDQEGALGIKINNTTPQAKVDLASDETGKAFKLVDGNQSLGRVLVGDKDGYVGWGMLKGMGGVKLKILAPVSIIPANTEVTLDLSSGSASLAITSDGTYMVMLRLTARYGGTGSRISEIVRIYRNDIATPIGFVENYMQVSSGEKISNYVVIPLLGVEANDQIKVTLYSKLGSLEIDRDNSAIIFYRL